MYTFVPKVQKENHKPRGDKPSMQIIDHRRSQSRVHSRSLPTESSALEIVMEQRNTLFDAELGYRRRINAMDKEAEEMAATLEQVIAENKSLKNNINRGPTRTDFNKLANEKKTLQNVIEKLGEENFELNEVLQRVMKRGESDWQEVFENMRRRQEERYAVFGPFVSRVQGLKKRTATMNDGPEVNKDRYDTHLNNIEKETQSLLNKLKQLKREKKVIDYSLVTGERKCFRNLKEFREVGQKLNRDLNKYTSQLDKLSDKHVQMIETLQESRGLHDVAVQTEEEAKPEPEIVEVKKKPSLSQKRTKEKLPQINSPKNITDSRPTLRKDLTLPAINDGNSTERQKTIVKTTGNTDMINSERKDNKLQTEEETDIKKTDYTKKKSPVISVKSSSPLSNKSKRSNVNTKLTEQLAKNQTDEITKIEKIADKNNNKRNSTKYGAGSTDLKQLVAGAPGKGPHR